MNVVDHIPHRLHGIAASSGVTQAHQPVAEVAQSGETAPGEGLLQPQLEAGGKQALAALVGVVAQLLQGGGANLAARQVHHSQEGVVIIRIHQQPQVGHDVLDLGTGEKRGATADAIGDAVLHQHLLQEPRLVIAAIEHGIVGPARTVHEAMAHDLRRHPFRLVLLVLGRQHPHRLAVIQLGEELLVEDVGVIGNQDIGALENAPLRAVVLLQLDDIEGGKILLQQHQILGFGPAPGVDGLVIIPHHGKAGALAHQRLHQLVLAGVGILILVHQQVLDLLLPALPRLLIGLEEQGGHDDEIVEIQGVIGGHLTLVTLVEQGHLLLFAILRPFERHAGQHQIVLPVGDGRGEAREFLLVPLQLQLGQLLKQGHLVGIIKQGEVGLEAQELVFALDDLEPQRVEGGDHQAAQQLAIQSLGHPLLHLFGRLVGEGDGADIGGLVAALLDEVGDLGGDDPGLARTGARQHQTGTGNEFDRLQLSRIQFHRHLPHTEKPVAIVAKKHAKRGAKNTEGKVV